MTLNEAPKTLLAVLAHPDDESFGMGGTLALYASRGVQVHLICATRGEAGSVDEDCLNGFDSIAARRESELRCAAGILGLSGVYFLGYRDSGMPGSADNQHPQALINAPRQEVAEKIAHYIRLLKPQVVLTFDPIGGYKHPDHIAIHQATVEAFHLAGEQSWQDELPPFQPQRLYFHLIPKGFLRMAVFLMRLVGRDPRRFGRNEDIDLLALVEEGDFPTHAVINYRQVYDLKDAASRCHESQLGGAALGNPLLRQINRLLSSRDHFMRAIPAPKNGLVEGDLFAGLADPPE
ncbi:MAG: PIG-L deacetylase family protein [Chloroflexota bacterium]